MYDILLVSLLVIFNIGFFTLKEGFMDFNSSGYQFSAGGMFCYAAWVIAANGNNKYGQYGHKRVLAALLHKDSYTVVKSIGNICLLAGTVRVQNTYYDMKVKLSDEDGVQDNNSYRLVYPDLPLDVSRQGVRTALVANKLIGTRYVLTDTAHSLEDCYSAMMQCYDLPVKKEWVQEINNRAIDEGFVTYTAPGEAVLTDNDLDAEIPFGERVMKLSELCIYDYTAFFRKDFRKIVETLLKEGVISITEDGKAVPELKFENMDEYRMKYGTSMVKSLANEVHPRVPLDPELPYLALIKKRLFPQQAVAVKGIVSLMQNRVPENIDPASDYGQAIMTEMTKYRPRHAFLCAEMGTGKTLMSLAAIEEDAGERTARKYEQTHKGSGEISLKDLYRLGVDINYRAIIMCPGHICEKWKAEILENVPNAKVEILNSLEAVIKLKERGIERKAKEFYIVSKDFAKLGSTKLPVPSTIKSMRAEVDYCLDCYKATGSMIYKTGYGKCHCEQCSGTNWASTNVDAPKAKGLVCPECGKLLVKYSPKLSGSAVCMDDYVLNPVDFKGQNDNNSICYHCGTSLWSVDVKNLSYEGPDSLLNKMAGNASKWHRIGIWKSAKKNGRKGVIALKGHEHEISKDWVEQKRQCGPRKSDPAQYIKKHMKNFFDYCVLDEAHKYEGSRTAQSIAAHALIKASRFTICATGTLTNGTADSLFSLLYMLQPAKMLAAGYAVDDAKPFSQKYGSVETVYDFRDGDNPQNKASRGKQLQSPKVKPGISPVLYSDFLMGSSIFMQLSDLSKFLPERHESVEVVQLPEQVAYSYRCMMDELKSRARTKEGAKNLSDILQMGLSYPDKPYGREPIKSASIEDMVLAEPDDHSYLIEDGQLLPKEQRLVDIVNEELANDRNVFVYATNTNKPESCITGRLKQVIEEHCNLKDRVYILESSSPEATKRENFIKKKAEEGIRVFITNPKNVETGLDFCFERNGKIYNYPTLVFYQVNYELSVLWQAAGRAYRLNQREMCKTIYMCYKDTLQEKAVAIMAKKKQAAAALQGDISSEGLASMASGVDAKVELARSLMSSDTSDANDLSSMFDVLNQNNNAGAENDAFSSYTAQPLYSEIMEELGLSNNTAMPETNDAETAKVLGSMSVLFSIDAINDMKGTSATEVEVPTVVDSTAEPVPEKASVPKTQKKQRKQRNATADGQLSLFDLPDNYFDDLKELMAAASKDCRKKGHSVVDGQTSIFALFEHTA